MLRIYLRSPPEDKLRRSYPKRRPLEKNRRPSDENRRPLDKNAAPYPLAATTQKHPLIPLAATI